MHSDQRYPLPLGPEQSTDPGGQNAAQHPPYFIRLNNEKTQLTDHSIFIAFAPKDNPKIAIAVFIENGYWGARWAAPIASLMIEKYIKGEVKRNWLENKMLKGSIMAEYEKAVFGKRIRLND